MSNFNNKLIKLYEILNVGESIEETLEYIFESFNEFIPYDRISIALLDNMSNIYSYALKTDYDVALKTGYSLNLLKTSLADLTQNRKPRIIDSY
ncbi:MAG: hypothetical protein H7Y18_11725 [Clostridiaceae bacterium]|nr:hypothetical protein [Clostridiaceae bacterium]